jgi:hypothetical protein
MTMQRVFSTALMSAFLVLITIGCASMKPTALRVAGTDGAEFTAYYVAGDLSGAVTSITQPDPFVTVLELAGGEFRCDVRKRERAADLDVELYRGEERVFQTNVPPGMEGVRIRRVTGKWRGELY